MQVGHCKSCIDLIEQKGKYCIRGIIDRPEKRYETVLSYEIIGCDEDIETLSKSYKYFFISIGYLSINSLRKDLFTKVRSFGLYCTIIVSPYAYVSKHAFIDQGTIIMHNVTINAGVRIGKNCIINTSSIIEHDVLIDYNTHVAPGAVINGGTKIEEGSFIGSNSVCRHNINIGRNSFVKFHSRIKSSIN